MKLAIVEWIDAWACSRWQEIPKTDLATVACRSVGWIVRRDKHQILLAGTYGAHGSGEEPDINQMMAIPLGFIKKITYVGSKYTIKA